MAHEFKGYRGVRGSIRSRDDFAILISNNLNPAELGEVFAAEMILLY
jgi:hypothetical protein